MFGCCRVATACETLVENRAGEPSATYDPAAMIEGDARDPLWTVMRRTALLDGRFPPPYRPHSWAEANGTAPPHSPGRGGDASNGPGGGLWRWRGCDCAERPLYVHLGGRLHLYELGPGELVEGQAGFRGQGLTVAVESDLAVARGRLWAVVTPRLAGSLWHDRPDVPDGLRYDGWPLPTGRPAAGQARRQAGWRLDLPRAAAGLRLGRWAVTGGLMTATVGPGLDGDGLTFGTQAASLPQIVLRRTAPLRWSGVMRPLAPQHVLLRVGWPSAQTARYRTEWGWQEHRTAPVFTQWLLTWDHTPWWRTTVTHAALAAPRAGETIWGDLPQINLPLLGATLSEQDYGPLTDRLFSLGMELRFRRAPWPLLPQAAGRLWWEYGGEDYRPHDALPFLPDIAAPASLAGCELVDARWDIGVQYLETRHPRVLWYGSTDFQRGYTHDGIVLGHPLGGAVEAWTGVIRLRPGRRTQEWELRGRQATWARPRGLPATARRDEVSLSWRRLTGALAAWTVAAGWVREMAGDERAAWFTARLSRSY